MTRSKQISMGRSLVLALLLGGCGGDVVRVIDLAPARGTIPAATTTISGGKLTLGAASLEPLAAAGQYVAWARGTAGFVALGAVTPKAALTVDLVKAGLPAAYAGVLRVTEEKAGALPATPSSRLVLAGRAGGTLSYVPVPPARAAAASAVVRLTNRTIKVTAKGLPELPDGFGYALWLGFKPALDDHHAGTGEKAAALVEVGSLTFASEGHGGGSDEGGDDACGAQLPPASCMPRTLNAGTMEDHGMSLEHGEMVAGAWWAFVTVESRAGKEAMSPVLVLWGQAALPAGMSAGEGGGHAH